MCVYVASSSFQCLGLGGIVLRLEARDRLLHTTRSNGEQEGKVGYLLVDSL